jgi:hypothetical protein
MQARVEKMKKDTQYKSEALKYWNRETQFVRGKQRVATGFSRAKSDAYVSALYALGKGRQQQQALEVKKRELPNRFMTGDSRTSFSRTYGRSKHKEILAAQAQIESSIDTQFGRNMDAKMTKISRYRNIALARNREKLGVRPEYGAPVMMPPKGDTTMANLGIALSIAQLGLAFSDSRLKENMKQVDVSPNGYKIYEWNYKTDKNTRFRGVVAQDVVKINPMAVSIVDNYLAVNYNKIDVDLEVVS